MWVRVTEHGLDGGYQGILDNDPVITDVLCGDVVTFQADHIVDILKNDDDVKDHTVVIEDLDSFISKTMH